ncbi:hypothetical protein GQ457_05G008590 [Hibiscus cannabinus]
MLAGKRSRRPMKRTTSMAGITVDVVVSNSNNVEDSHSVLVQLPIISDDTFNEFPRNPGGGISNSNHVVQDTTAPFLRSCCLCKRRLAPARDIYMYRGDTAFCSLECREQQMKLDETREIPNFLASKKGDRHASCFTDKISNLIPK